MLSHACLILELIALEAQIATEFVTLLVNLKDAPKVRFKDIILKLIKQFLKVS